MKLVSIVVTAILAILGVSTSVSVPDDIVVLPGDISLYCNSDCWKTVKELDIKKYGCVNPIFQKVDDSLTHFFILRCDDTSAIDLTAFKKKILSSFPLATTTEREYSKLLEILNQPKPPAVRLADDVSPTELSPDSDTRIVDTDVTTPIEPSDGFVPSDDVTDDAPPTDPSDGSFPSDVVMDGTPSAKIIKASGYY